VTAVGRARCGALLALALCAGAASAQAVAVEDDEGQRITLAHPARRIISLSPGITETLFAVDAGAQLIGTSEYSDYPPAARDVPRVARAQGIDLERIAALRPDLIVFWGSGYPPALRDALRRLGPPVYVHEPRTLEQVATSIERLGRLAGSAHGEAVAARFRARRDALAARYGARTPVRVFYQVWENPLMTLSGRHVASEVMRLCGAVNVFDALGPLVATIDVESVIAARPQVILAADAGGQDRGSLLGWRRHPEVPAVAGGHLVVLDADALDRASLRLLDAATQLCEQVDRARQP